MKQIDINNLIQLQSKITYLQILNYKLKYVSSSNEVNEIEKICKILKNEIVIIIKKLGELNE